LHGRPHPCPVGIGRRTSPTDTTRTNHSGPRGEHATHSARCGGARARGVEFSHGEPIRCACTRATTTAKGCWGRAAGKRLHNFFPDTATGPVQRHRARRARGGLARRARAFLSLRTRRDLCQTQTRAAAVGNQPGAGRAAPRAPHGNGERTGRGGDRCVRVRSASRGYLLANAATPPGAFSFLPPLCRLSFLFPIY
jgi:hypothetical protein